jgi:hypothetical protein
MADTHAAVDLANQGMAGGYVVKALGSVGGTRVTEHASSVASVLTAAVVCPIVLAAAFV